jgi:hypothetical protein
MDLFQEMMYNLLDENPFQESLDETKKPLQNRTEVRSLAEPAQK